MKYKNMITLIIIGLPILLCAVNSYPEDYKKGSSNWTKNGYIINIDYSYLTDNQDNMENNRYIIILIFNENNINIYSTEHIQFEDSDMCKKEKEDEIVTEKHNVLFTCLPEETAYIIYLTNEYDENGQQIYIERIIGDYKVNKFTKYCNQEDIEIRKVCPKLTNNETSIEKNDSEESNGSCGCEM